MCTLCCPNGNFSHEKFGSLSPKGKAAATESRYPTVINYKVHVGSFRVSIIHRTLRWTTGSLTCVRDHSYACVYTRGSWAHLQRVSTTFLTRKKTSHTNVSCAPATDGVRTSGLWISSPTLSELGHAPPPSCHGTGCRHQTGNENAQHDTHRVVLNFATRINPDGEGGT